MPHRPRSPLIEQLELAASRGRLVRGCRAQPADQVVRTLGADVAAGQHPHLLAPGGVWQSAAPAGGEPVPVSCLGSGSGRHSRMF